MGPFPKETAFIFPKGWGLGKEKQNKYHKFILLILLAPADGAGAAADYLRNVIPACERDRGAYVVIA